MPYFRSLTFSSIASDGHRRSGILMLSPRSLRCTGPINLVQCFFSNFHFFKKMKDIFIFFKKMKAQIFHFFQKNERILSFFQKNERFSFFSKKWRIIFHFFQKNEGFLSFFPKKWRISFIFFKKMKETFSGSRIIGPVHRRLCQDRMRIPLFGFSTDMSMENARRRDGITFLAGFTVALWRAASLGSRVPSFQICTIALRRAAP